MRPITAAIGWDQLPERIRALNRLDRVDYADAFSAPLGEDDGSVGGLARRILEESPLGPKARRLWRALGLRMGPTNSPDHVQGWRIVERGESWMRLETGSWYTTAHALFEVSDGQVTLALFLRDDNRLIAPLVRRFIEPIHQRGAPGILGVGLSSRTSDRSGPSATPPDRQPEALR